MSSRINFTKAALDQLAPPPAAGSRLTVRDTKVAGLELRVTSNGVKTFSLLRWVPGSSKPERITIGRFPDLSVEQARKMAGTHIAEIASGANPADKRRRARAEMTFADLFDEYLKRHARVHNKTWGKDVEKYKLYLSSRTCGPPLSSMKLSEITRGEIAKLHAKIGTMHPGAANRTLALISSVFGRAIEWDLYDKLNPAKGVRKFPERSRERVLWEDDLPRFFEALEKEPSPDLQDFFLLCLFTGARRGNVQAMRWADINLDRRQWTVSAIDSKNKHEIHIALSEEAVAILNGRKADAGRNVTFVFPGDGRTGRLQDPRKAWERLLNNDEVNQLSTRLEQAGHPFIPDPKESLPATVKRARHVASEFAVDTTGARFPDLRMHDLRRTLGAWQAKFGASTLVIGKSLGHLSQASTQVYARLDRDPVHKSVSRATAEIAAAGGYKKKHGNHPA